MEPDESYPHQNLDEQPKDLTIKTAKKMKPIPPPLNLSASEESGHVPVTLLKEFANFATSPKSPLMQKHLPFRKRAHMISAQVTTDSNADEHHVESQCHHNEFEHKTDVVRNFQPNSPVMSNSGVDNNKIAPMNEIQKINTVNCEDNDQRNANVVQMNVTHHGGQSINQKMVTGGVTSNATLVENDGIQRSPEGCVLDLSMHQNSVLLSPAPSSLGSSREELASDSARVSPLYQTRLWGLPWPPPIWHCFQSDTRLKVGSVWCSVEEMGACPADLPPELKVEKMSVHDSLVIINFSSCHVSNIVLAEVNRAHAFLVKDRGWTAVCGETLFSKYSVRCPSLQLGDIVMLPTIHRLPLPLPLPSPDICERIKRFSFPPDDPQSLQLLSPPTTPTRKNQDCDKPKRPMNAFMLFAKRFRLELIQSHPGKDNRAISVILGEVWRTLPQEEREIYIRGARDLSEEQKLLHPDCWKRKRSHSTS